LEMKCHLCYFSGLGSYGWYFCKVNGS
jgi:hypothetical protein